MSVESEVASQLLSIVIILAYASKKFRTQLMIQRDPVQDPCLQLWLNLGRRSHFLPNCGACPPSSTHEQLI